jgi:hypothetical protein
VRFDIGKAKPSKPLEGFIPNPKLKLLDQVSEVMRFKHYSMRTETTYREWIRRFILFHGKRHPREMGAAEVGSFLSRTAVARQEASSTQNQDVGSWLYCDNIPEGTTDGRYGLGRPFGTLASFAQRPNFEKLGYSQTSLRRCEKINP